jgi:hypothetical protein
VNNAAATDLNNEADVRVADRILGAWQQILLGSPSRAKCS